MHFPSTIVTRAVYDAGKKALIVTLKPGSAADAGKPAPWHIGNLQAKARYALWIDGRRVACIGGGKAQVLDSSPPGLTMTAGTEGSADVQSVLNGPTTFILSQEH